MWLWSLSFLCGWFFFSQSLHVFRVVKSKSTSTQKDLFSFSLHKLYDVREKIKSGLVEVEFFQKSTYKNFPHPWNIVIPEVLQSLREEGAKVMPSLERLIELLTHHQERSEMIQAKTSLVYAQSMICLLFLFCISWGAPFFFQELRKEWMLWSCVHVVLLLWAVSGFFWLKTLSTKAIWVNHSEKKSHSYLWATLACEKLISWMESGEPADIAYQKSKLWVTQNCSSFSDLWNSKNQKDHPVAEFGRQLEKEVFLSFFEGKSCKDKIYYLQQSFQTQEKVRLTKALEKLPIHALKPLFLCFALPVLCSMGCTLFLILLHSEWM